MSSAVANRQQAVETVDRTPGGDALAAPAGQTTARWRVLGDGSDA